MWLSYPELVPGPRGGMGEAWIQQGQGVGSPWGVALAFPHGGGTHGLWGRILAEHGSSHHMRSWGPAGPEGWGTLVAGIPSGCESGSGLVSGTA
jgi:hypothetical protein